MADITTPHEGRLKIFLGFAPGCGKTYAMLDEAVRRKKRGQDVVIAAVDTRGRPTTADEMEGLEVIPALASGGPDIAALLNRKPSIAIIDDLHRDNPPGSRNPRRWQDIQEAMAAGISVLTTVDVYHLESLNNQVHDITGIRISETVPDQIFHGAEEIEMCDATPRALINRYQRGEIFPLGDAGERGNLYDEGVLSALREMAFREAAGRIDEDLLEARKDQNVRKLWAAHDKVLICITASRRQFRLIRRGWRIAQRLHADIVAVHVEEKAPNAIEAQILADDFLLAEKLGIPIVKLKGPAAPTLIQYARDHNVTELVIGHSHKTKLQELTRASIISELVRELKTVDILIVAVDEPGADAGDQH